jgi:hypothetical protein
VSEAMERAHETIHEHAPHTDGWARGVAVLISALAAALALTDIGGKAAQTAYITHHVEVSNDWAFYQAKNLRAVVLASEATVLASLPGAAEPAAQERIKAALANSERMRDDPAAGDGMKQLAARAQEVEIERNEAAHRYHNYEYAVGLLELAIVLASVSVVIRVRAMTIGAGVIGGLATLGAIGVALNLL